MGTGLEVKSINFGELREMTSAELHATGRVGEWDGLMDGSSTKLVLANGSDEVKKAYIYTISIADIPSAPQWSWGKDIDVKPGEQKEVNDLVPMPGISSSDCRDYTGPLRYAVEVRVTEPDVGGETILRRVKYYDIPAKVPADELAEEKFDISKALEELEKTTVLHDLHIGCNPKEGLQSIKAKLLNFGEKTQYIGIDTRAERKGTGWQTQFFHEVGPGEEITVDIGAFIPEKCPPGMERLMINAVSIPEEVFRSHNGRRRLIGQSYKDTRIAKFDFYFRENE